MKYLLTLSLIVGFAAAQLPNCTDVGVYLCNTQSERLCDDYCKEEHGSTQKECKVFDDSFRTDCQCEKENTGCFDVEFNASAIPTCQEFDIYGCTDACTKLCASLANTINDEGRKATCNPYPAKSSTSKCMCDGLAVCDDESLLPPTPAPTFEPSSGASSMFGMLTLAFGSVVATSIISN